LILLDGDLGLWQVKSKGLSIGVVGEFNVRQIAEGQGELRHKSKVVLEQVDA